jgi:microcompartment protein CcmK/EutM
MILARVVGNIESTHKYYQYEGLKLLYVQPVSIDLAPTGNKFVAADSVDAGPGDLVLIMQEGRSSWEAVGKDKAPINRAVIAVVDEISLM